MAYRTRLEGDSFQVTTLGDGEDYRLKELVKGLGWRPGVYADEVSIVNLQASGGHNLLVGPNGKAMFPLQATLTLPIKKVQPGEICVNDGKNAITFAVVFGGEPSGNGLTIDEAAVYEPPVVKKTTEPGKKP